MRNISCEFEISTYNTLCSRGPTKVLAESQKNACGGHLVFQNEAKNIPRQDFKVMNISCKFEKASYNISFVRAVMVKSLYTLRQRRNKAKSIVSTGSSGYNEMAYQGLPFTPLIFTQAICRTLVMINYCNCVKFCYMFSTSYIFKWI